MLVIIVHQLFHPELTFVCAVTEAPRDLFLHVEMQNVAAPAGQIMQVGAQPEQEIVGRFDPALVGFTQPIFANKVPRRERAFLKIGHPEQVLIIAQTAAAAFDVWFLQINAVAEFFMARKLVLHPLFDVLALITGHAFYSKQFSKFPGQFCVAGQMSRLEHRRLCLHVAIRVGDRFFQ